MSPRRCERALGERCTASDACAAGSYCLFERCVASGAENSTCELPGGTCDAGMVCVDSYLEPRCVYPIAQGGLRDERTPCAAGLVASVQTYTRVVPGTRGAPCDAEHPCDARVGVDDRCDRDAECPDGTQCVEVVEGESRCVAPGGVYRRCGGAFGPCAPDLDCVGGGVCVIGAALGSSCGRSGRFYLFCADGVCSASRQCVVAGGRGQPCRERREARCDAGLVCSSSTCVDAIAPGQRCSPKDRSRACDGVCVDGVCRGNTGRLGEGCDPARPPPDDCEPGAVCSSTVCVANRTCGPGVPCPAGLVCVENVCVAPSPCNRAQDLDGPAPCGDGGYCVRRGDSLACVPAGVEGSRCRLKGHACEAGLTCSIWGICRRPEVVGVACSVAAFDAA